MKLPLSFFVLLFCTNVWSAEVTEGCDTSTEEPEIEIPYVPRDFIDKCDTISVLLVELGYMNENMFKM